MWTSRNNLKSSNSGDSFSYPMTRCQDECLSRPLCVAVDVSDGICIVHTDPDDLTDANTKSNSTGFTQYIVDRECHWHLQMHTSEPVSLSETRKTLDHS